MEILTTENRSSWADKLWEMEVKETIHADVTKKTAVRSAIWNISNSSSRKYITLTIDVVGVRALQITRLK